MYHADAARYRRNAEALTEREGDGLGVLPIGIAVSTLQFGFDFISGIFAKKKAKKKAEQAARDFAIQTAIQYIYTNWPAYLMRLRNETEEANAEAGAAMGAMMTATGTIAVRLGEQVKAAHRNIMAVIQRYEKSGMTIPCCGVPEYVDIGEFREGAAIHVPRSLPMNPHRWTNPIWPRELKAWAINEWDQVINRAKKIASDVSWVVGKIPAFAVHVKAPVARGTSRTVFIRPPPPRVRVRGRRY